MQFRKPSSLISKYYDWRVTSFVNALVEGIVFLFILLSSLILLSLSIADFAAFVDAMLYVLFVLFLTFLSSIQTAWRVREINERENRISSLVGTATDKVGLARQMVDDLISQGSMGDGRVWFALYRLTQKQNQVGWSIRDVLLEKGKEMREMEQQIARERGLTEPDSGPGIES